MSPPRRIAIVGAECVGKTLLAQALAEALQGLWVPEYLRSFCDVRGRPPVAREQAQILEQQIALEDEAIRHAQAQALGWVFADSAPLMTALYSHIYFDDASLDESADAHHRHYDATLLLVPDLPWEADGFQRESPAMRARVHALLQLKLGALDLPVFEVSGSGPERLARARAALAHL